MATVAVTCPSKEQQRRLLGGGSSLVVPSRGWEGFPHWLGRRLDWSASTVPINSKTVRFLGESNSEGSRQWVPGPPTLPGSAKGG